MNIDKIIKLYDTFDNNSERCVSQLVKDDISFKANYQSIYSVLEIKILENTRSSYKSLDFTMKSIMEGRIDESITTYTNIMLNNLKKSNEYFKCIPSVFTIPLNIHKILVEKYLFNDDEKFAQSFKIYVQNFIENMKTWFLNEKSKERNVKFYHFYESISLYLINEYPDLVRESMSVKNEIFWRLLLTKSYEILSNKLQETLTIDKLMKNFMNLKIHFKKFNLIKIFYGLLGETYKINLTRFIIDSTKRIYNFREQIDENHYMIDVYLISLLQSLYDFDEIVFSKTIDIYRYIFYVFKFYVIEYSTVHSKIQIINDKKSILEDLNVISKDIQDTRDKLTSVDGKIKQFSMIHHIHVETEINVVEEKAAFIGTFITNSIRKFNDNKSRVNSEKTMLHYIVLFLNKILQKSDQQIAYSYMSDHLSDIKNYLLNDKIEIVSNYLQLLNPCVTFNDIIPNDISDEEIKHIYENHKTTLKKDNLTKDNIRYLYYLTKLLNAKYNCSSDNPIDKIIELEIYEKLISYESFNQHDDFILELFGELTISSENFLSILSESKSFHNKIIEDLEFVSIGSYGKTIEMGRISVYIECMSHLLIYKPDLFDQSSKDMFYEKLLILHKCSESQNKKQMIDIMISRFKDDDCHSRHIDYSRRESLISDGSTIIFVALPETENTIEEE